jgi:N-sulfoglucosamine sulfohydrolase
MISDSRKQFNVLLITSEDNGPQLSCYGDSSIQTPNLDRLAAEGACFENAYITQAVCSPSRASILTGLYPHQNGQIGLSTHSYSMWREYLSIPALLKKEGYRTGRLGKLHVAPESSCPFDMVWNDPDYFSFQHRDVKKAAEVAGEFMGASDAPFFLMLNYPDAHLPWLRQDCGMPERPFVAGESPVPEAVGISSGRLMEHAANYYSCIKRLDIGIGMVIKKLEELGKLDHTLIIYLADHGPQFSRGKGANYELAVQVPFIVYWPGLSNQGMVKDKLVSSIDIFPTILDALGLSCPELPGRSLRPLLEDTNAPWREYLFCEWNTSHPFPPPSLLFPQRSVRNSRYKLIQTLIPGINNPLETYYTEHALIDTGTTRWEIERGGEEVQRIYQQWKRPEPIELYDLENDPHEFTNLANDPAMATVRNDLFAVLTAWREETNDPLLDENKLRQLIEEDIKVRKMNGENRKPEFKWAYLDYLYDD